MYEFSQVKNRRVIEVKKEFFQASRWLLCHCRLVFKLFWTFPPKIKIPAQREVFFLNRERGRVSDCPKFIMDGKGFNKSIYLKPFVA